jgi:hypothetical protein
MMGMKVRMKVGKRGEGDNGRRGKVTSSIANDVIIMSL